MIKYEYLQVDSPTIDQLNELGGEGWELVSVIPPFRQQKWSSNNEYMSSDKLVYVFKRVK